MVDQLERGGFVGVCWIYERGDLFGGDRQVEGVECYCVVRVLFRDLLEHDHVVLFLMWCVMGVFVVCLLCL